MTKLTLRSLAAHRLRLGLTALAVILGVSFVSGTLIFKDTMTRGFDGLFSDVYKDVEVIVQAKRSFAATEDDLARPIPQSVLTTIRERTPAAAGAAGAAEGYAAIVGKDGEVIGGQGMTNLGGGWTDAAGSDLRIASGRPPRAPDEVVIDSASAGKGGLRAGDRVEILTQGPTRVMRVSGTFTLGSLGNLEKFVTYALFTPEVAQELLVKPGHYSQIYVRARPGVSPERLRDQVAAVLPGGYEAVTGQQEVDETKAEIRRLFDLLAIFLLIFAAVSVFVGSFIIFNTFSMLVAQRSRELALLRAVGASRRQVTRSVLGEAVGVGLIGSTLGLAAGAGLAVGLRVVFTLFDIDLPATRPVLTAPTVLWSYAVGMIVTVVAAYLPARRAAKIPPVAAMRDDIGLPERSMRIRLAAGAVLMAGGGSALAGGLAGSGEDGASLVGLGAGVVFLAVAMLSPVISRPVTWLLGWPIARLAGAVGRLSRENTRRNPRRTAATASALMIGLALVAMVSVLAESMKTSVDRAFDRGLGADFTMRPVGIGGFSPEAVEAVAEAPGVSGVTPVRLGTIKLVGHETPVMVADPPALVTPIDLEIADGTGMIGPDELLVQRNAADQWGWSVGSTVAAEYPDGVKTSLRVAGIFADNQVATSPYIMAPAGYRPHAPSELVQLAYVDTEDVAEARRSIESALAAHPNVILRDREETKAQARQEIDQLVAVIIALLVLSVIIAALGIVNTLALSVIERTREIGLLRAVGMSRRQLRRMVRYESVVIAVFGATLGLAVGVASGWALQRAMADQGVDVLTIPFGRLAGYAVVAAVIGVIAAIWPARRAARMDVLRAITTQ
ncbi:ABC transporter permease [Actinomadura alba]|uniref:ABC transporter permease n=2 Tax=Actinomadura alba TaxID=406431 RepID=A0ABR7LSZ3_9ACTN|nr:ABC transporter permease [Actinomadura alba]